MTRIQIRRDTSSNWATYNPVLADGEFALETDTRKLKIGNGEQPYNDLAYQEGETYTLPPATADTLGGIKVGDNLSITEDGVLNATGGTAPSNMVTTDTAQDITANKSFKSGVLLFYNENKPKIAINNTPASISLSYEGNISADSSHILRDTNSDWRVGRYNKQGIISSSTPLQRMGAGPYFNRYPILDSSNLGSHVDGTTITYTDGKLKASGGSAPTNMVTTDTGQTITGIKTFTTDVSANSGVYSGNNAFPLIVPDNSSAGSIQIRVGSQEYTSISLLKLNAVTVRVNAETFQYRDAEGQDYNVITEKNIPTKGLKYWTGTEANYTGLATKNADTLYRLTDTNTVYLGTIQLSN